MKVTTENVFASIGAKTYASGVLSTYSFEPSFFELRAMSAMRRVGVRNVVALVDQNMLDDSMESPAAKFLDPWGSYGLLPMGGTGLFHPKVMLLAGEGQGLLALGSGNLTSAGHGTNAELWSMLHVQDFASDHARLFVDLWDALREGCRHAQGVVEQRLRWFEQYATWIAEVRSMPRSLAPYQIDGALVELVTHRSPSPLSRFLSSIGEQKVRRFTIVSPFFDKGGAVISHLLDAHGTAEAQIVVDDRWGSVPAALPSSYTARCAFHRWQGPSQTNGTTVEIIPPRLHAKLLVAHLADGTEVMLIGSSNTSVAGLGTPTGAASNAEMNLIIRRERSDILQDLGIVLRAKDAVSLEDLYVSSNQEPTARADSYRPVRIILAEYEHPDLVVYFTGPWTEACVLLCEDLDGTVIHEHPLGALTNTERLSIPKELGPSSFVRVRSLSGTYLSNRMPIQPVLGHQRCDPDKQIAKLESVLAEVDPSELGHIEELLSFADLSFDEGSSIAMSSTRASARRMDDPQLEGEILDSYDEFMTPARSHVFRDGGLALSPNVRIADFLSSISRRQMALQVDINPLEQFGDEVEPVTTPVVAPSPETEHAFWEAQDKERRAIQRFLKRYSEWLTDRVDNNKESVSVIDLSNFLIASYLVLLYAGRRFKRKDGSWVEDEFFLALHGGSAHYSIKQFCWSTIGDLGILLQRGLRDYSWENTTNRAKRFHEDAILNALACVCRSYWSNSERNDVDLVLVNLLLSKHAMPNEVLLDRLRDKLTYGKKDTVALADIPKNITWASAMHVLSTAIKAGGSKEVVGGSELRKGQWIFTTGLGAFQVVHPMRLDDKFQVACFRPGSCKKSKGKIIGEKFARLDYTPYERT